MGQENDRIEDGPNRPDRLGRRGPAWFIEVIVPDAKGFHVGSVA